MVPLAVSPDASWTFPPGALVLLVVVTWAYVRRWRTTRGEGGARSAPVWRLLCFLVGVACLVAALISPVDRLAEQLLAMHMVQHMLLLDISSVLILLGFTRHLLRPVTRRLQGVEARVGVLAHPAFAVAAYVGLLWVWHVPALYDLALEQPMIHVLEHLVFSTIGLLYWWHLLSPVPGRHEMGGLWPVAYMLATKLLVGFLGIALTFAPEPLYGFYEDQPRFWGLSALDDQSLAGAIMAIEQSLVMGAALAWLFVVALARSERDEERRERYGLS